VSCGDSLGLAKTHAFGLGGAIATDFDNITAAFSVYTTFSDGESEFSAALQAI